MSISLSKRLIVWMTQKRSEQEKSCRGGKVLYPSSHRSVFFNVRKRSLTAEAKKGNVPQSVSISAWASVI